MNTHSHQVFIFWIQFFIRLVFATRYERGLYRIFFQIINSNYYFFDQLIYWRIDIFCSLFWLMQSRYAYILAYVLQTYRIWIAIKKSADGILNKQFRLKLKSSSTFLLLLINSNSEQDFLHSPFLLEIVCIKLFSINDLSLRYLQEQKCKERIFKMHSLWENCDGHLVI